MQSKFVTQQIVLLAGITLLATLIFLLVFWRTPANSGAELVIQGKATSEAAGSVASSEPSNPLLATTTIGRPVSLIIPAIKIIAPLDSVGLTPDGALGIPDKPSRGAWYNLGPRPGEIGSAVIDGHFGWKNNIPAVFDTLHTLRKGDKIHVLDEYGVTSTFVVRELRIYDKDDDAQGIFNSTDGKIHLNLITCQGVWNKVEKSYFKRLVVFSDLAD